MKVEYRNSFTRDLRRVRNAAIRSRILRIIEELEAASAITEIRTAVRITDRRLYYRIRVGDYRLGIMA